MLAQRKGAASAELAANPPNEMYEFHSGILPDVRDVPVYLPAQYFEDAGGAALFCICMMGRICLMG
jgi:hypothetical protein